MAMESNPKGPAVIWMSMNGQSCGSSRTTYTILLITEALSLLVAHAGRSEWIVEQAQVKGRS